MTTDVYGDILFLINAGMDCLSCLLTARLLRRRIRGGRLALASLLGGVYAVAALFVNVGRAAALALDCLMCLCLCALVFLPGQEAGRRRWLSVFPACGVYLLVSLVLGGVMTGLYNLLNRAGCPDALAGMGADGPTGLGGTQLLFIFFALLALLSGLLSLWGGRLFRRTGSRQEAEVTVALGNRSVTLSGLIDSGNLLTDPLDGKPVIPVQASAAAPLLSAELAACISEGSTDPARLRALPKAARLRIIPAATATGHSLLIGIRPDRVTIRLPDAEGATEAIALIAPLELPEAGEAGNPALQALIPAALI